MKRIATLIAVLSLFAFGSALAAESAATAADKTDAKILCPNCSTPLTLEEALLGPSGGAPAGR